MSNKGNSGENGEAYIGVAGRERIVLAGWRVYWKRERAKRK